MFRLPEAAAADVAVDDVFGTLPASRLLRTRTCCVAPTEGARCEAVALNVVVDAGELNDVAIDDDELPAYAAPRDLAVSPAPT